MQQGQRSVSELSGGDSDEVIDVLCEAFSDYSLVQFVVGPEDDGYADRLQTLIRLFVVRRVLCDDRLLGVGHGTDLDAAAVVSRPGQVTESAEFRELHEATWRELGEAARLRYESYAGASAGFAFEMPHIHLNMIGTRRRARGSGLGRLLLDRVHRFSFEDAESTGVTLTTERLPNVSLYRHFGYRVVGEQEFTPGLRTWGLFRPDR